MRILDMMDARIRAVIMNGSRTNPSAIRDIFQDYDIEYVVNDTKSFREDKHWIDQFGERISKTHLGYIEKTEKICRMPLNYFMRTVCIR